MPGSPDYKHILLCRGPEFGYRTRTGRLAITVIPALGDLMLPSHMFTHRHMQRPASAGAAAAAIGLIVGSAAESSCCPSY